MARIFLKTSIHGSSWEKKPNRVWDSQSTFQVEFITTCQSLWLCGSQLTVENSERDTRKFWKEYQTTWPASGETYMQVRKQQLELHMEQQTGSK